MWQLREKGPGKAAVRAITKIWELSVVLNYSCSSYLEGLGMLNSWWTSKRDSLSNWWPLKEILPLTPELGRLHRALLPDALRECYAL